MTLKSILTAAALTVASFTAAQAGTVAVFGEQLSGFSKTTVNNFYNGLAGHSSSLISSITGGELAGVDLLWATQPSDSYSAAEVAAMSSFLSGGGRIAFMGEHGTFGASQNTRINAALSSLGSTMSINNLLVDRNRREATVADGQILSHPLLNGVNTYDYAAFAPLTMGANGIALMVGEDNASDIMMGFENVGAGSIFLITDQNVWDNGNNPFDNDNAILFENLLDRDTQNPNNPNTIPLPAAGWMLLAGLGGLTAMRRRKKA